MLSQHERRKLKEFFFLDRTSCTTQGRVFDYFVSLVFFFFCVCARFFSFSYFVAAPKVFRYNEGKNCKAAHREYTVVILIRIGDGVSILSGIFLCDVRTSWCV